MSYYRRRTYRRPSYRRRRRYKKPLRYKYADYAYKGYKMAMSLKRTLNVEYKHIDIVNTANPTYAGSLVDLNQLSNGDTDQTRDGDSIKMIKMTFRYTIRGTVDSVLRLIIFNDKYDKVSLVSDVLSSTGGVNSVNSFKDRDNRFQTKFLVDRRFPLSASGKDMYSGTIVKNLYLHANYDGATTTPIMGRLRMLLISDVAADMPVIDYVCRITFVDN